MTEAAYTWSNKRTGTALVRAKLDRGFGNRAFVISHPHCTITMIPMQSSDHHALKFIMATSRHNSDGTKNRPSCIEPWWLDRNECFHLIQSTWQSAGPCTTGDILQALQHIKSRLHA